MAARAIGSGTISFGLVSIPVKLYVATHSEQVRFHLLHAKCKTRIKQQLYCPHCKRVVDRKETVRGYEVRKGRWVVFTEEEIDALEAEANRAIEIEEFVPLADVDPIYFKDVHYLGPAAGDGAKAYRLLAESMRKSERVAVAQFAHHGKEHVVLIRAYEKGLVLHSLYYADEVRKFDVDIGRGTPRQAEITMAERLIRELSTDRFRIDRYEDHYRARILQAVKRKQKGEEIAVPAEEKPAAKVVDLAEALRQSLGQHRASQRRPARGRARSAGRARGQRARVSRRRA